MHRIQRFPRVRILASFLIAAGLALPAQAHDCWLRPSSYTPEPAAKLSIDVCVGMQLKAEIQPRKAEKIVRFFALDPAGASSAIGGVDGKAPAGEFVPDKAGLWWLGYENKPNSIELEAAKFEAYLREEGLESVIEARKRLHEESEPGRELYSRSVKSLVRCGKGPTKGFDRDLGQPLELVLCNDPFALRAGEKLEFELRFRGKPLAGALVGCQREGASEESHARTDEKGRVRFELAQSGMHLAHVVHMLEAESGSGARWRSYWSSLSFEFAPLPAVR